jgi:transcription initiation factor TFIIB
MIEALKCSACNKDQTTITDPESGEIICSNCGVVILEGIEDYAHEERRAYSMEELEHRSRTGAPTSLAIHDRGLSTTIDKVNKDANGKILDSTMLPQMNPRGEILDGLFNS